MWKINDRTAVLRKHTFINIFFNYKIYQCCSIRGSQIKTITICRILYYIKFQWEGSVYYNKKKFNEPHNVACSTILVIIKFLIEAFFIVSPFFFYCNLLRDTLTRSVYTKCLLLFLKLLFKITDIHYLFDQTTYFS